MNPLAQGDSVPNILPSHDDGDMRFYHLFERNLIEVRRRLDTIQSDVAGLKTDIAVMKAKGEGTNESISYTKAILMAVLAAILSGLFAVLARSVGH